VSTRPWKRPKLGGKRKLKDEGKEAGRNFMETSEKKKGRQGELRGGAG